MLNSSIRINHYIGILPHLRYKNKISLGHELPSKIKVEFIFISFPFSEGNFNLKENIILKWRNLFLEGFDDNTGF